MAGHGAGEQRNGGRGGERCAAAGGGRVRSRSAGAGDSGGRTTSPATRGRCERRRGCAPSSRAASAPGGRRRDDRWSTAFAGGARGIPRSLAGDPRSADEGPAGAHRPGIRRCPPRSARRKALGTSVVAPGYGRIESDRAPPPPAGAASVSLSPEHPSRYTSGPNSGCERSARGSVGSRVTGRPVGRL